MAAMMPIGMPMRITHTMVMEASRMLVSAPSAIADVTGAWKRIERPRSPVARLACPLQVLDVDRLVEAESVT